MQLKQQLQDLGATQVLTYDDLTDKNLRDRVKTWLRGKVNELKQGFELWLTQAPPGNTFGSQLCRHVLIIIKC